jgi:ATP:corrinoid adenosyltransferase
MDYTQRIDQLEVIIKLLKARIETAEDDYFEGVDHEAAEYGFNLESQQAENDAYVNGVKKGLEIALDVVENKKTALEDLKALEELKNRLDE